MNDIGQRSVRRVLAVHSLIGSVQYTILISVCLVSLRRLTHSNVETLVWSTMILTYHPKDLG